jgi:cobyrinic acid a,c-diamide synthase
LGKSCLNIDLWAMRPMTVTALRERLTGGGALTVVESAMGLFDGAADGTASAADFAAPRLACHPRGRCPRPGAIRRRFAGRP